MTYNPATLPLNGWLRGSYIGDPWHGTASAGASGDGFHDILGSGVAPGVGTAVNGFTPASFNGTSQAFQGGNNWDGYLSYAAGTISLLVKGASAAVDHGALDRIDNPGLVFIDTGGTTFGLGYSDAGATLAIYDSTATYKEIVASLPVGQWGLVQCRWDGVLAWLRVATNGVIGPWQTIATDGPQNFGSLPLNVGMGYAGLHFAGDILDLIMAPTALADADLDGIGFYAQATYGLSIGFASDVGIARPGARPFGGVAARGPLRQFNTDKRARVESAQVFVPKGIALANSVGPVGGVVARGPHRHMRTAPACVESAQVFLATGIDRPVRPINGRNGPARHFPQTQAFLDTGAVVGGVTIVLAGLQSPGRFGSIGFTSIASIAVSGVDSSARLGSATIGSANTLALAGARTGARLGAPSFVGVNTVALSGASSRGRLGAVAQTSSYNVALRGVPSRARVGSATVGCVLTLAGAKTVGRVGAEALTTFVTIAPSGVRSDSRLGRSQVTTANTLALTGLRSRAAPGSITVVPSAVAVALSGLASKARLGSLVLSAVGGAPSTIALSGVRVDGRQGHIVVTPASTIAPMGVYADAKTGAAQITTLATVTLSGARARAAIGRVAVSTVANLALSGARAAGRLGAAVSTTFYTLAPVGVRAHARLGRAQLASSTAISLSGLRARAALGRATVLSSATIAIAGVGADARPGTVVALNFSGFLVRLSGLRATAEVGPFSAFVPGVAAYRATDRPLTDIRPVHVTLTDFATHDQPTLVVKMASTSSADFEHADAPLTRISSPMSNYPYNIGDVVVLTWELRVAGALTNATTVALTVHPPSGSDQTPTVTNTATGKYEARVPATVSGTWRHRLISTGTAAGAEEGYFEVKANSF